MSMFRVLLLKEVVVPMHGCTFIIAYMSDMCLRLSKELSWAGGYPTQGVGSGWQGVKCVSRGRKTSGEYVKVDIKLSAA